MDTCAGDGQGREDGTEVVTEKDFGVGASGQLSDLSICVDHAADDAALIVNGAVFVEEMLGSARIDDGVGW